MKTFIFLFCCCLGPLGLPQLAGQGFTGDWRLSLSVAGHEHDLRAFYFKGDRLEDLKRGEESRFSWHGMVALSKPFLSRPDFSLEVGMAYGLGVNTHNRNYDYCYLTLEENSGFVCPLFGFVTDNYMIHQIHAPLSLRYRLAKLPKKSFIYLSGELIPSVSFRKVAGRSESSRGVAKNSLRPYALEVNTGLGYQYDSFSLECKVRAFHRREWDPVLVGGRSFDVFDGQGPPTPVDTHNFFKLWLTLSYDLRAGQPPRSWWGKSRD